MTRLLFYGGALADLGASLLHLPNTYQDDWARVVLVVLGGLVFSGAWRTMQLMLEMTARQPLEIRIR